MSTTSDKRRWRRDIGQESGRAVAELVRPVTLVSGGTQPGHVDVWEFPHTLLAAVREVERFA